MFYHIHNAMCMNIIRSKHDDFVTDQMSDQGAANLSPKIKTSLQGFLYDPQDNNGFYIFKWLGKTKEHYFCDTWKVYMKFKC